jgi:hypothetical protein
MNPYTAYVLAYSLLGMPVLMLHPVPYGRFSDRWWWNINPRLAWFFMEVGGLFIWWNILCGKYPISSKGWVCLVFISVHYLWRSCLSQLLYHRLKVESGEKKTPIAVVIASILYLPVLGLSFSDMVTEITDDINTYDYIYLIGATSCLIGNIYCDVFLNVNRNKGEYFDSYYGRYLTSKQLKEYFKLFTQLGIYNPNYYFEIMEWGFLYLFAFRSELFWWFICSIIFLVPRGIWNKTFMDG